MGALLSNYFSSWKLASCFNTHLNLIHIFCKYVIGLAVAESIYESHVLFKILMNVESIYESHVVFNILMNVVNSIVFLVLGYPLFS